MLGIVIACIVVLVIVGIIWLDNALRTGVDVSTAHPLPETVWPEAPDFVPFAPPEPHLDLNASYYVMEPGMQHRLQNDFTYHAPFGDQAVRYGELRDAGKRLAEAVVIRTPVCREQSLALTKIEEAIFWANAAVSRHERK